MPGDRVSISLPSAFHLSRYNGTDELPGYVGKRYALQVGPIVLACVGPMNEGSPVAVLPVSAHQNASDWLLPLGNLHYHVKGADTQWEYMPLFDVPADAVFTTFPVLDGS